jgi:uncharacterized protein YaaN involved in tellurite resistance
MNQSETGKQLVISTDDIKKDIVKSELSETEESELSNNADSFANQLFDYSRNDISKQEELKSAIENTGLSTQKDASRRSNLLKEPIRRLSQKGADGGPVANAMVELKITVEGLDPGNYDFEAGWISRSLSHIPGVGTPLQRYFTKFESADTVIAAIVRSLKDGGETLVRDNKTLIEDQKSMRGSSLKLEKVIKLARLIDEKLSYKLEREIGPDEEEKRIFIETELIYPLRQRILDLQQQLGVNQQGVMAFEVVIRSNKELIRGVNRACDVTITALEVAVTVALALANQKIVLDKINALNTTTSKLIANTAKTLRTQGVEIQKMASGTQLDMESLKSAFADINAAINDLTTFRQAALPQMSSTILEMSNLSEEAEKSIQRLENGNRNKSAIDSVNSALVIDLK